MSSGALNSVFRVGMARDFTREPAIFYAFFPGKLVAVRLKAMLKDILADSRKSEIYDYVWRVS